MFSFDDLQRHKKNCISYMDGIKEPFCRSKKHGQSFNDICVNFYLFILKITNTTVSKQPNGKACYSFFEQAKPQDDKTQTLPAPDGDEEEYGRVSPLFLPFSSLLHKGRKEIVFVLHLFKNN